MGISLLRKGIFAHFPKGNTQFPSHITRWEPDPKALGGSHREEVGGRSHHEREDVQSQ